MKPLYPVLLLSILGLCSCVQKKFIYKNQTVYKIKSSGLAGNEVVPYTLTRGVKANVDDKGDYLVLSIPDSLVSAGAAVPIAVAVTGTKADLQISGKKYFPENVFLTSAGSFQYFDSRFVLQGLTIPLKVRKGITSPRLLDSLPTQAETGFNVSLAAGWKFTHNVFKPVKNLFGQYTNRYSFSPGLLLGIGAADVKKLTTDYRIKVDRKDPAFSAGVYFMFGYNNLNIGYSLGWDYLLTGSKKDWIYNGRLWQGITVGFDIIK